MKEQPTSSHIGVATGSSTGHHETPNSHTDRIDNNNSSGKCFGGPCLDSEEEEEEDWDLGIGKLVIDLDADADKTHSPPATKASSSNSNHSPAMSSSASPQKTSSKSTAPGDSCSAHTSDKGLKMRIKRSSGKSSASMTSGAAPMGSPSTGAGGKQELRQDAGKQADGKLGFSSAIMDGTPTSHQSTMPSTMDRLKHSLAEKEKLSASSSHKSKGSSKKDRSFKSERANKGGNELQAQTGVGTFSLSASVSSLGVSGAVSGSAGIGTISTGAGVTNNVTVDLNRISMTPFVDGATNSIKRETPHDPYEFDAKDEDRIGMPIKKMKVEKGDAQISPQQQNQLLQMPQQMQTSQLNPGSNANSANSNVQASGPEKHDVATETSHVGVVTDPDCLGPCEPGTSVVLEGLVWNETDTGLLVVNVTWRGKTYVGTLMDATKHCWAPPRLNCDSPSSDLESRTPKGRGKRRAAAPPPRPMDNGSDRKLRSNRRAGNTNIFAAPLSPARIESLGAKRKARADPDPAIFEPIKANKRTRTDSRTPENCNSSVASTSFDNVTLIECPEPHCNKKYRHINGLKYHQSHAHKNSLYLDSDGSGSTKSEQSKSVTSPSDSDSRSGFEQSTKQKDKESSKKKSESKEANEKRPEECVKECVKVKVEADTADTKQRSEVAQNGDSTPVKKKEESKKAPEKPVHVSNPVSTDVKKPVTVSTVPTSVPDVKKVIVVSGAATSVTDVKKTVSGSAPVCVDLKKPITVSSITTAEIKKAVSASTAIAAEVKRVANKPTPIAVAPVTMTKAIASGGTMVYQITGTQIGLVSNSISLSTQAPSQPNYVTTATLVPAATKPILAAKPMTTTALSTLPMTVTSVTTVPATVAVPTAIKSETEKKKKDKSEKKQHKVLVTTRPIMPAPTNLVTATHGTLTQAGISQANTATSLLKPIQPKPTILGGPVVSPALASLIKEKKSKKKKKDKDKDRERHKDGEKSHHHHHEKNKVEMPSVIKTAPSATVVRPNSESVTTLLKVDISTPPQLEKQQPVGNPSQKLTPNKSQQGTQLLPKPITECQAQQPQDQDAHSPAYSDISDANESAPTLEKETQPSQDESTNSERPPSVPAQDGHGVYSPYYGQPPCLTPAVPPANVSQENNKDNAASAPKVAIKQEPKEFSKASAQSVVMNSDKKDSASRPPSTPGTNQGQISSPDKINLDKAAQMQQQQQQQQQQQHQRPGFPQQHGQYQYVPPYGFIDQNSHMQLMNTNPEYRERMFEEQRRRQDQMHQQQRPPQNIPQQQQQQIATSMSSSQVNNQSSQAQPNNHGPVSMQSKISSSQSQLSPQISQQQQQQNPQPHAQMSHPHPSPQSAHHSPQIKQTTTVTQQQPSLKGQSQQKQHHNQQHSHHAQQRPQQNQAQQSPNQINQSDIDRSRSHSKSRPSSSESKQDPGRSLSRDEQRLPDDKPTVSKPPPSLISDREKDELRKKERERTEQNLRDKQNENRQILRENIAIKEQMDGRVKYNEQYNNKGLYEKQQEELQRYYMFHQQRYLEQQRYREGDKPGQENSSRSRESMMSPHAKSEPTEKPQTSRPDAKRESGHHSRDSSKSRDDERPKSVDRSSATSSPRVTPKLVEGSPHPVTSGAPIPGSYAQYYSHPYLGSPHYGGQIPFDPNHPGLYPGVNPVIGYAGQAYIHPSQIRYHVPGAEAMPNDKVMMLSPGVQRPEGKALDLLQHHASQYYNSPGAPHKIHELQEVAKREKAGSPAPKEVDRPDSANSAIITPDGKGRDSRISPPTQRHLHTHHHTHVMGGGYPMSFGAYPSPAAPIMPSASSAGAVNPSPIPQHAFPPK